MVFLVIVLSIVILLLAAAGAVAAVALLRVRKGLSAEIEQISDYVGSLACGDLTRSFPAREGAAAPELVRGIYDEIKEIKRSYNNLTDMPLKRVCYIGTDPYLEGSSCARAMAEHCGDGAKVVVIITVSLDISSLDLRYRGFRNTLMASGAGMEILKVFEAKGDAGAAHEFVKASLRDYPGLKGIYVSGSSMAVPAAKALAEARRGGSVALVCHDLGKEMAPFLRDGIITSAILQDPIIQGHDSIIAMQKHLSTGWAPLQPRLLCVMDTVTKDNCERFWDFEKGEVRIGEELEARMLKPAEASGKRTRIAVLGQEWNEFFLQVKSGSMRAIQELRSLDVDVEWIAFNQARRSDAEIIAEIDALVKKFIKEKYSGIVSIVGLKGLVPYLNKAVAAGIPVVTFNAEPLGLLGMLSWLESTTMNLQDMSVELNDGSEQIRQAMEQISIASFDMVDRINRQGESTKDGLSSTERLTDKVAEAVSGEESQLEALNASFGLTERLSGLTGRFRARVEGMEAAKRGIEVTTKRIKDAERYSGQIGAIVTKIDDIAERTSILAINASIQAARVATESGKGFKVIADGIRELSTGSSGAVVEVAGLVEEIQKAVGASVREADGSSAEVQKQLDFVEEGAGELDGLSRALVEISEKIKETSKENAAVMLKMREDSEALKRVMDETSQISMENGSAIEELSASAIEISAQTKEIAKLVALLKDIVMVLKGSLAQFETKRGA
jgi:methyl-accepting chemotaxis protein